MRTYHGHCSVDAKTLRSIHEIEQQSLQKSGNFDNYNPLGASIFVLYIILALVSTGRIILHTTRRYSSLPAAVQQSPDQKSRLRKLGFASIASFATLSFNMLSFLIASFQDYDYRDHSMNILLQIWDWTLHSTLFTDFAWELVDSPRALLATQWGLAITVIGTIMLGTLMRMIHGECTKQKVPQISAVWYIVLAQILPVSFAVSLALIDLFLIHVRNEKTNAGSNTNNEQVRPRER